MEKSKHGLEAKRKELGDVVAAEKASLKKVQELLIACTVLLRTADRLLQSGASVLDAASVAADM